MKNVHFLPWVGSKYNIGWQGKRLMIMGESHYCASLKDAVPSITHDIIADLFDADSEHEAYKNTYTKFMRSLAGHPLSNEEKREAWNRVLFYNFVQEPLTGPRKAPTAEQFRGSDTAFFEVLETFRPDCIIAWGKRLYDNLPRCGHQLNDVMAPDGKAIETWAYETRDGHAVQVLPIMHPSAAFSPDYWHEVIESFLSRQRNLKRTFTTYLHTSIRCL